MRTFLAILAGGLLALPAGLRAQDGWTFEASAGRAVHDPVSARVGSTHGAVGVGYEGRSRWLYLSTGAPLGDPGPAWGAAGAGGWLAREWKGIGVGVQAGAHGFGYGAADSLESGGGGTLELLPTLVLGRGGARLELSSGFVGVADVIGDSTDTRPFHDSGARLAVTPIEGVEVSAGGRWLRGEDGDWPYAGGAVTVERGWGSAWAYAGRWLDETLPDPRTALGVGASVRVLGRTEIAAAWRQEPLDPLYFNAPRRTWSVQLRQRLGRSPRPSAPPSVLPEIAGTRVTFRLPKAEHAAAPALLGDFTGWEPVAMTEAGGFWEASVTVPPGVYHYAYRGADGGIVLPAGVRTVDDGMGGMSAVLVVP